MTDHSRPWPQGDKVARDPELLLGYSQWLEAENTKLREALKGILSLQQEDMYHGSEVSHAHAIARSALENSATES